ncbi:rnf126-prov protein, putative [Brugia malayi]|uniref:Bm13632 n=1 Tax=Brugia malayi TaxID=6279 RepID=A0A0J9Y541_BRUMA|nr:rnf126-prov protein, putative [Brugia malayi]CDQ01957.1 Bm13632 [Brugia malayi]VIO96067.1 rnf126-prov protein, putative [Brugia malayi]
MLWYIHSKILEVFYTESGSRPQEAKQAGGLSAN